LRKFLLYFVRVFNQTNFPSIATPKLDTTEVCAGRRWEKKKMAKALNQLVLYTFILHACVHMAG